MIELPEIPMLMVQGMVYATLNNLKSETRRVVMPTVPKFCLAALEDGIYPSVKPAWHEIKKKSVYGFYYLGVFWRCPYGSPGQKAWVRETHAIVPRSAYRMSGVPQALRPNDAHDAAVYACGWKQSRPGRWRPSIHMPRWASRILLEIIEIRIERLHRITAADIAREGIIRYQPPYSLSGANWALYGLTDAPYPGGWFRTPYLAFEALWDSINGDRPGCAWKDNPLVWVIKFKRLKP